MSQPNVDKGGNRGYGKTELIKMNVDKFSPVFWKLMGEMAKSQDFKKQTLFITEFNKIQTKMIPQTIAGDKENPIPIINITNVPVNNSDQKANEVNKENPSDTRRLISEQDNININLLDSISPERQDTDANIGSVGVDSTS